MAFVIILVERIFDADKRVSINQFQVICKKLIPIPLLFGEQSPITFVIPVIVAIGSHIDLNTSFTIVSGLMNYVSHIENDPLPEELKDVACAYVHHMDTDEPIHYTAQPEFNLDAMAILDAGIRSSDSGKIELVNNLHWQIG